MNSLLPLLLVLLLPACTGVTPRVAELPVERTAPTAYVNPFIGTGGHGHTFPGATRPYGMVQLSPDTRTLGWDACGGYHHSDSSMLGFSHTHLSGTGIGDYGDVLFMPSTGAVKVTPGTPENPDAGYRSRFSHQEEEASPGYYRVRLADYDIRAELTATVRAGFHRYTFPAEAERHLIIDLAHTIHGHQNPVNEFRVISDREIIGYKQTQGWAQEHHVYFYARFNTPFSYQLFVQGEKVKDSGHVRSTNAQAVLTFAAAEEPLLVQVGLSAVDSAGARRNLESELTDWDFEATRAAAATAWETQLSKVDVEGGSADQRTIFYTALYHTAISPNVFSDVDGRYRGMDQQIHQTDGKPMYTVFSLWDTFRAFHPLQTILSPAQDELFINSLLAKYEEGGVLPKWELAANYTGTMTGDHAIPVIYDAYQKGIRGFDVETAYRAMVQAALYDTSGIRFPSEAVKEKIKPRAKHYNEIWGYIPADRENESISKALEFAYNDWCIAQMAKALGKTDDYARFAERSTRYQRYFDRETGFMRGKNADGRWRTPFSPRFSRHRRDDYTEGNAWQWTWFVPHDVPGLITLMGGASAFQTKLDSLFTISSEIEGEESSADISGLIGQYAHGNEPSHHIAHLYNFVGASWKTQQLTDSILTSLYFNDPNGLSGNEDCGQMSAWYLLNAMGFYSFCPGTGQYSIGRPLFDEVRLHLENGKTFTITTQGNRPAHKFIQSATLNGQPLPTPFFTHDALRNGGTLELTMGATPAQRWNEAELSPVPTAD
ncbi:GH92 family glycosyl hydrolase [Catalinimonas alkaloidigena]|nr:GH92 family glycosyl hydrolase [Catalinimonas alkaloidigena]